MEPVRFGLLGTSRIARSAHLAQRGDVPAATVLGIAGRNTEKAKAWRMEFGLPKSYPTIESLIADPSVEAVIITLPNALHFDWALRAIEAGKHVMCEKPLALQRAQALQLCAAANRRGVVLHEGFMYRENPKHHWVLEQIRAGAIGELRHVHAELTYPMADPANDARADVVLGGGSLFDAGCYAVDAVGHLFARLPEHVSAHEVLLPSSGTDACFHGTLDYGNGTTATITSSFGAVFTDRYFVLGSHGRIDVPSAFPGSQREATVTVTCGGDVTLKTFPGLRLHAAQLHRFAVSVRARNATSANLVAAVRNATTLEWLKRAANERQTQRLPDALRSVA